MNVSDAIKERRSVNFFEKNEVIPDAVIREIIEIANLAPSSANLQPWEVIVVNDPERKRALKECAFNQPRAEEAAAVIIIIANPGAVEANLMRGLESWAELGYIKRDDIENQLNVFSKMYGDKNSEKRRIFAVKNSSFFAMSIMIAAREFGFETHPMDGFSIEKLREEFHIPDDRLVPLLIAIGHKRTGTDLLPRAYRRDYREFVRFNNFHCFEPGE